MRDDDDPIIRQFLAGRALGPIGMDELATEQSDIEKELVEREVGAHARPKAASATDTDILTV